jgi:hypothetical protein
VSSTRDDIRARDLWRCVRCGVLITGRQHSVHHRILGSRKDMRASNLITLCGSGTTGCHGDVHARPKQSRLDGYIVSRYAIASTTGITPVLYQQGGSGYMGWHQLDDSLGVTSWEADS